MVNIARNHCPWKWKKKLYKIDNNCIMINYKWHFVMNNQMSEVGWNMLLFSWLYIVPAMLFVVLWKQCYYSSHCKWPLSVEDRSILDLVGGRREENRYFKMERDFYQHTEVGTKWQLFWGWHFKSIFKWKYAVFLFKLQRRMFLWVQLAVSHNRYR